MKLKTIVTCLLAALLAACAGKSGTWAPGCAAYEGDRITLDGGEFSWDRFTDQVVVDADGTRKDLFPDYPKHGTFDVDGDRLRMTTDSGERLPDMVFVELGSSTFLLTEADAGRYRDGGGIDACSLTLEAD